VESAEKELVGKPEYYERWPLIKVLDIGGKVRQLPSFVLVLLSFMDPSFGLTIGLPSRLCLSFKMDQAKRKSLRFLATSMQVAYMLSICLPYRVKLTFVPRQCCQWQGDRAWKAGGVLLPALGCSTIQSRRTATSAAPCLTISLLRSWGV
jgi:hypothetical protein